MQVIRKSCIDQVDEKSLFICVKVGVVSDGLPNVLYKLKKEWY